MSPLVRGAQQSDSETGSQVPGAGLKGRWGVDGPQEAVFRFARYKSSRAEKWRWLHSNVSVLNASELYT